MQVRQYARQAGRYVLRLDPLLSSGAQFESGCCFQVLSLEQLCRCPYPDSCVNTGAGRLFSMFSVSVFFFSIVPNF